MFQSILSPSESPAALALGNITVLNAGTAKEHKTQSTTLWTKVFSENKTFQTRNPNIVGMIETYRNKFETMERYEKWF